MSVWQKLRDLQDAYENAAHERPRRHGSEEMARDEAAGDSLALLLAVVEAAAVYRDCQKKLAEGPTSERRSAVRRAKESLDEALVKVAGNEGADD